MDDGAYPHRRRTGQVIASQVAANDAGERLPALDEALRSDARLIRAVRESRAFAVDLASALVGIPFVQVTKHGGVSKHVPPWSCTALQAATLIADMRGMGEDPREILEDLNPNLIIRNTATEVEDHINRLGWRVW